MSRRGSPGTATRSAHFPASTVPTRSLQPRISAFTLVAATSAAIGDSPRRTRMASSRALRPWGITAPSVPRPMGMPASSARLKPAYMTSRIWWARSISEAGTWGERLVLDDAR